MGSRRSWASGSFREVWQAPPDVFTRSGRQSGDEDEEELRWAAIERLPTYDRLRKSVLSKVLDNGRIVRDEVDVTRLCAQDKKQLMDSILKTVEDDNDMFLRRLRDRTDRFCSLSFCDFLLRLILRTSTCPKVDPPLYTRSTE